jgi:hypothetical protein
VGRHRRDGATDNGEREAREQKETIRLKKGKETGQEAAVMQQRNM